MRLWGMLLTVLPLMPTGDVGPARTVPCAMAIALDVHATLAWGSIEWHLVTGEVDRMWAPYGVTFCWIEHAQRCEGLQVRIRVLIADDIPPLGTADRQSPVGRIYFEGRRPVSEIWLSVTGARQLVARARLGDRLVASWPESIMLRLLPRVLGRALSHEIGHYVLRSREHSRTGLMAPSFRPDDVTWGATSRFALSRPVAAMVEDQCRVPRLAAR
jgi:hypothetical protein